TLAADENNVPLAGLDGHAGDGGVVVILRAKHGLDQNERTRENRRGGDRAGKHRLGKAFQPGRGIPRGRRAGRGGFVWGELLFSWREAFAGGTTMSGKGDLLELPGLRVTVDR